jgi:hypothetical protein
VVTSAGMLCIAAGLLASSFADSLTMVIWTYGVGVGVGVVAEAPSHVFNPASYARSRRP